MGAKDSKPSFISYEDAAKRVSDSELRRIREAFKRCSGANGATLSLEAFVHEVLCDGVPFEVAEWLYQACGGTKRGISFKDLLCGIVVLTKGNIEEKIKFLWTLYVNNQNDNGTYIYKKDFAQALHIEKTSLTASDAYRNVEILTSLFGSGEKVTFEQFRSWLIIHKDATVLSKWLLYDRSNFVQDLATPTFYQSLAGVTHLEEREIIELEKCFWTLRSAAGGALGSAGVCALLSPPLPRAAAAGLFRALDDNCDDHVDFKELCCGLSAACRGPTTERLKFCFKIFDQDRDGVLNKTELVDMVGILCTVANEAIKNQGSRSSTPTDSESERDGYDPEVVLLNLRDKLVPIGKDGRVPKFQLGPTNEDIELINRKNEALEDYENIIGADMVLTAEDFLIWSVESVEALVTPLLELIFEVCHVVLGLRPQCRHQERDIVLGWMRREAARGQSVGQFWYLVSADWWASWLQYAAAPLACCRARTDDDSLTTNSTESMGSLLWRADTASLGSAGGSSGVGSAPAPPRAPHPGPIDNTRLLAQDTLKVRTLTGEGGLLRRDLTLAQHRDFELLPDALWRALAAWYGAPHPLPRQVIRPPNGDVELELYPLQLKILRHVASTQSTLGPGSLRATPPERQLAYSAAFSRLATVKQVTEFLCGALGLPREDVRLWALDGAGAGSCPVLLDDERPTLHELGIEPRARLLLERRNPDLTWPEEITQLCMSGSGRMAERRETLTAPDVPGATGLHNLGNTCFMNAALQAVWNTEALTRYFNSGMQYYEVNTTNPLGTKGELALRFGELCNEVWTGSARSVAPLRVRACVTRHARALAGGGQHDAQELLAWLLDALHEDLNRAAPAPTPPVSTPAPTNTPDTRPDQVVAAEAWSQHVSRNDSVMTELFYGQLKSKVRCRCGRESVRFDAFNMLSLPLPLEAHVRSELRVIRLDGSVPIKYGVRVDSEGTYLDLKIKLSKLCGLPPESMVLVLLSGALVGRILDDRAKVAPATACDLYAYEVPPTDTPHLTFQDEAEEAEIATEECAESGYSEAEADAEAEAGAAQRSKSEILMSQSPPDAFYNNQTYSEIPNDIRSRTLPNRPLKHNVSSPTLSMKSFTLNSRQRLAKTKYGSSPSNMYKMNEEAETNRNINYLFAIHRKQVANDAYFVSWQRCRPATFGVPLVVSVRRGASGRELYAAVWAQLARLISARPPAPSLANHAADCDDSLGYEFPFRLRVVDAGGAWCALCGWPALCRGCALPADDAPLVCDSPTPGTYRMRRHSRTSTASGVPDSNSPVAKAKFSREIEARRDSGGREGSGCVRRLRLAALPAGAQLAVDWDPTALHLRYQAAREKAWQEHESVAECAAAAARPIDLASCLRAFTSEERLEQRYHCEACRSAQPATKKLQIWRLPPVLIIHLKRFQYVNNKWVKSQKVVNFPFQDFDPTPYLASVPQETILRHIELKNASKRRSSALLDIEDPISESDSDCEKENESPTEERVRSKERVKETVATNRKRLESTSLTTTPVQDDNLVDYHQHHLLPEQDPFDLKYRLYAVVSHSGELSGGHYVAYARNPRGAWLCYNDSSCRVLPAPALDPAAAYLLFYERRGLRADSYLPDVPPTPPVPPTQPAQPSCALT
ncbi:ubiquitin carboxyl-terminal hydrolase 32 isoform X2 [Aricia agestis]|uniref:ubiquitin carboxyl-terminal hydrolase 32 isoform X2 n=1 Tax=Aricia agestis TaxID=91739 RepID=UPI001C20A26F|nr:ubiquitin carboxyl-terminal hydrolase 32 isoform X2 [Aricia agestis]